MKHYLTIALLFFMTGLFAQKDSGGTQCAANAGVDQIICYSDRMKITAPFNAYYAVPPNIKWTYLGGPLSDDQIEISPDDDYSTEILNKSGSPDWPTGEYYFLFCVDCNGSNGHGAPYRECDTMKVTVKPDVTIPVMTPVGEIIDGRLTGCHDVSVDINSLDLAPGESYYIRTDPKSVDLYIEDDHNGHVTINGNNYFRQCDFDIIYNVTNDGCEREVRIPAHIVDPFDPNRDGIIKGRIEKCPSCSRHLELLGDSPSCHGKGTWQVIDAPVGATYIFSNVKPSIGDADVEVSAIGNYTFVYTVTGIYPCPDSHDTLRCSVLDIDSFGLGDDRPNFICGNILAAGSYEYCFNELPNTFFVWGVNHNDVAIEPGNSPCASIIVNQDIDLSLGSVDVLVRAIRFYIDSDCSGPQAPELLQLPYLHDGETVSEVEADLKARGLCYYKCFDEAYISYSGAPNIKVVKSDINFLCTNGSITITLGDYFSSINNSSFIAQTTLVSQDPQCLTLPEGFTPYAPLAINLNECGGCGVFKFQIDAILYDFVHHVALPCTTSFCITVHIETAHPVTAGTDQVKCPGDPIRLNGSDEYCGAFGTWTRIYCSSKDYYNVVINDIHDHNTEIFVTPPAGMDTICPPDTLCFVWSYVSEDGDCDLSDTTRVIIRDSCCNNPHVDCDKILHVASVCQEGALVLTVLDDQDQPVDPAEFTVHWLPMNIYGNPAYINYTGPVAYTVEVYKIVDGDTLCYTILTGTAKCDLIGCGAKIVESCTEEGNVILTLVDAVDGHVINPVYAEDEIHWTVYGGGANDNSGSHIEQQNPITIQQDACYSLRYDHFIYPNNGHGHIPGTQSEICHFDFPKTCVSIECPGPCADFSNFMIAGCSDILALSLGLTFPDDCQSVCTPANQSVTLGLFQKDPPYAPLSGPYNILWENHTSDTYVTGNLLDINSVTITDKNGRCPWHDSYKPECPCDMPPAYLHCEQPIVKHCYEDGTFDYTVGAPQIVWSGVPGATGYIVEVTTGSYEGCCNMPYSQVQIPVTTTYWNIPHTYQCFSVRVRAITPYCSETTAWSDPYLYCPQETTCSPVITVCGCCAGARSAEATSLPINIVPEDVLVAYLKEFPGTAYPTLNEALKAAGITASTEPEFKVFPNPASDRIIIQAGQSVTGTFEVRIYDLLQQQWRKETFEANGNNALNISDLPEGVYLISILNAHGDRMLAEKITVLRK